MATATAKVMRRVGAEARIASAQQRIIAVLNIEGIAPVVGRVIDPDMRIVQQQENLAYWLELVALEVEKSNVAKLQADVEENEAALSSKPKPAAKKS